MLLFFQNFEIWGSFNEAERQDIEGRRENTLFKLNKFTSMIVIIIEEFLSSNSNYGSYVNKIIQDLLKVVIYFEILRTTMVKKKSSSITHGPNEVQNESMAYIFE